MRIHKLIILLLLVSLIFVSTASADDLDDIEDRFTDLGNDEDKMEVMQNLLVQQYIDVVKIEIATSPTTIYYIINDGTDKATISPLYISSSTDNMWILKPTIRETGNILDVLETLCDEKFTNTLMWKSIHLYRSLDMEDVPRMKRILLNFVIN